MSTYTAHILGVSRFASLLWRRAADLLSQSLGRLSTTLSAMLAMLSWQARTFCKAETSGSLGVHPTTSVILLGMPSYGGFVFGRTLLYHRFVDSISTAAQAKLLPGAVNSRHRGLTLSTSVQTHTSSFPVPTKTVDHLSCGNHRLHPGHPLTAG